MITYLGLLVNTIEAIKASATEVVATFSSTSRDPLSPHDKLLPRLLYLPLLEEEASVKSLLAVALPQVRNPIDLQSPSQLGWQGYLTFMSNFNLVQLLASQT